MELKEQFSWEAEGMVLRQVEDFSPSNGVEQYDLDVVQNLGSGVSQSWISVPALPFSSFMIFEQVTLLAFVSLSHEIEKKCTYFIGISH